NISLDVTYTSTANGSAAKLALPITPTSGNSALAVGFCNEGSINALVRTAANIEIVTTTGGTVTNANMSLKGIVLGGGYVGS
ncbi:MAG TPA: hypothetical protein VN903_25780, partial [Polyangia bacterium]|nr:hypothetical protein [Polyangia bacterium]